MLGVRAGRPCIYHVNGIQRSIHSLSKPASRELRPFYTLHRHRQASSSQWYSTASTAPRPTHDDRSPGDPHSMLSDESSLSIEANARQARLRYGSSLPGGLLSNEEYNVYERLYGPPVSILSSEETTRLDSSGNATESLSTPDPEDARLQQLLSQEDQPIDEEEEVEEEEWDEAEDEERWLDRQRAEDEYAFMNETHEASLPRTHPLTMAGRFGDSRAMVSLPEDTMLSPTSEILGQLSNKHIKEVAQKIFGSRLEDSVATPTHAKNHHLHQKGPALTTAQTSMTATEAGAFIACNMPGMYASVTTALAETRKRLGSGWLERLLRQPGGPRILDVGSAGAAVLSWREILRAEWTRLHPESNTELPQGKSTVVVGAAELSERISSLSSDTTFLPRLPDFDSNRDVPGSDAFNPSARKQYDVIIASHTLWAFPEDYERKQHVQNLWSLLDPQGGVLLFVEKGVPRGFELIGGARQMLLDNHIASPSFESTNGHKHKEQGMIVAPCTNHGTCPMYRKPGAARGRKDYCHFATRFVRPSYLGRLLGIKARAHERIRFSFLAVQRGRDLRQEVAIPQDESATAMALRGYEVNVVTNAPNASSGAPKIQPPHALSLPRLILPPLKRHGHIIFDVCTPAATMERWILSRSRSKQAYRDARKARWGDLWALGAKTRMVKEAKAGTPMPLHARNGSRGSHKGRKGRMEKRGKREVEESRVWIDD